MAAFKIANSWKRNWFKKKQKKVVKERKPEITLYGSSMTVNTKQLTDFENATTVLELQDLEFERIDIYMAPHRMREIERYGGS